MGAYIQIGQRYKNWNLANMAGEDFIVLDPKEMLLDFIKYKNTPVEWDLKTAILVGGQGSGKTVFIRYFVQLVRSNPDFKGLVTAVRTDDPSIIGDKRYSYLFEGKKVIVLIIDDAITEGIDSRESMSKPNRMITRKFCETRHILEENYGSYGIIFMIFATQSYTRIDHTIRTQAKLRVFCEYYDEDWFRKLFTDEEAELLRIASYEGMFGSNFEARRFALARTNTQDVVTLEIPYSSKAEVTYPHIKRSASKKDTINKLIEILLEEFGDLEEYSKSELKGFLEEQAEEIEQDYQVSLSKTDFVSIINRASWRQRKQRDENGEPEEKKPKGYVMNTKQPTLKDRIVGYLYAKGESTIASIAKAIMQPHEEYDELYAKVNSELDRNPDLFIRTRRGVFTLNHNIFSFSSPPEGISTS